MQYYHVDYKKLHDFCVHVFQGYGFTEQESTQITDVLLDADLSGIESHGIQRLIRYHKEITGGLVKLEAKPEVVFETPLSAVIEGNDCMGQILGVQAMQMAIDKAKAHGFGMITVRNSNHYYPAAQPAELGGPNGATHKGHVVALAESLDAPQLGVLDDHILGVPQSGAAGLGQGASRHTAAVDVPQRVTEVKIAVGHGDVRRFLESGFTIGRTVEETPDHVGVADAVEGPLLV